jgi:GNAT superfamily N-acetyltransferase
MLDKLEVQLSSPALALLESDAFYFELAAQRMKLSACEIAFVPDLISLPVSCVAQRVDERLAATDSEAFVLELEEACYGLGAPMARLYLHENSTELEASLLSHGFQAKVEIGFIVSPTDERQPIVEVALHRVTSDEDWKMKLSIHRQEDVGSDGYRNRAEEWIEMMYRKCRTGFKETFLILYRGVAVGTIGIVDAPGISRVKNLFIVPEYRGLGLAASAVKLLLRNAARKSIPTMGVFGIEGSTGCSVYRSCGFEAATRQVEYTKRLGDMQRTPKARRNPR